jgi:hypothetical protein
MHTARMRRRSNAEGHSGSVNATIALSSAAQGVLEGKRSNWQVAYQGEGRGNLPIRPDNVPVPLSVLSPALSIPTIPFRPNRSRNGVRERRSGLDNA